LWWRRPIASWIRCERAEAEQAVAVATQPKLVSNKIAVKQ
jgi:hypothetical protein